MDVDRHAAVCGLDRHGVGVGARRYRHGHAVAARRRQVDPVHSHPVAGYHPQARGTGEDFLGHVVQPGQQAVGITDRLDQFGRRQRAGTVADLPPLGLQAPAQARVVHPERTGRDHHHALGQRA